MHKITIDSAFKGTDLHKIARIVRQQNQKEIWNCHFKVSDDLQHKYPSLKWICFTRSNRQRGLQQVHPNTNYYCHVRRHPPGKKQLQNKHALSDVPLWRIEGSQTHSDKNCAPNHSLYIHSIPKETAWFPLPPSLKVRKVCFKWAKTLDVYVEWL